MDCITLGSGWKCEKAVETLPHHVDSEMTFVKKHAATGPFHAGTTGSCPIQSRIRQIATLGISYSRCNATRSDLVLALVRMVRMRKIMRACARERVEACQKTRVHWFRRRVAPKDFVILRDRGHDSICLLLRAVQTYHELHYGPLHSGPLSQYRFGSMVAMRERMHGCIPLSTGHLKIATPDCLAQ